MDAIRYIIYNIYRSIQGGCSRVCRAPQMRLFSLWDSQINGAGNMSVNAHTLVGVCPARHRFHLDHIIWSFTEFGWLLISCSFIFCRRGDENYEGFEQDGG